MGEIAGKAIFHAANMKIFYKTRVRKSGKMALSGECYV